MISISLPSALHQELRILELDTFTVSPHRPRPSPDRLAFVTALQHARIEGHGTRRAVDLNPQAARYLVSPTGAFANSIEIWSDKLAGAEPAEKRKLKSWITTATRLGAKVTSLLDRGHFGLL